MIISWMESQKVLLVSFLLSITLIVDANNCTNSTICVLNDHDLVLTCNTDSSCCNMIFLIDKTTQYVECYDGSCENATFFLTQNVQYSQLRFYNADSDNYNSSNLEWISLININIYTSADHSRIGIFADAKMKNMNVYAGSIYEYLPDWFSTTFSSYYNESYWEPLTSQSATTLYLYGNENAMSQNVNVYCNGSVDSCIVGGPTAASDNAINDVTIFCTITNVESTSIAYPGNQGYPFDGFLSPDHPKCIFWCPTNTTCNVELLIWYFTPIAVFNSVAFFFNFSCVCVNAILKDDCNLTFFCF